MGAKGGGRRQDLIREIEVAFGAENDKAPRLRSRAMRHSLLLVLLIMAAASPAAAQSCATLGGPPDCLVAPTDNGIKSPQLPRAGQDAVVQGYAETTVSNRGVSTTLNNKVIDSHGTLEFGFSGSMKTRCRSTGYGTPCE